MGRLMRMRILTWALLVAACALVGGAALNAQQPATPSNPTTPVTPSDPRSQQGRQISLHDQLRVGLKAVTKADFAFIDLVVAKVNARVLPRSLVDSTFLWARRRVATRDPRYAMRPMVYFQPAIIQRARAIGVTL
jgi:hypothetical protein